MGNTKQKETKRPVKSEKHGKRGKGKFATSMKETIYAAFHELGGKQYLVNIGKDDPKTFLGLMSKVIPAELQVSGTVLIDVGQAMVEAEKRKLKLEATRLPVIDVVANVKALKDKDKV